MSKLISSGLNSTEYILGGNIRIPIGCMQWVFGNPNQIGDNIDNYVAEVGNTFWQVPESNDYMFEMKGGVGANNGGSLCCKITLVKDTILELRVGGKGGVGVTGDFRGVAGEGYKGGVGGYYIYPSGGGPGANNGKVINDYAGTGGGGGYGGGGGSGQGENNGINSGAGGGGASTVIIANYPTVVIPSNSQRLFNTSGGKGANVNATLGGDGVAKYITDSAIEINDPLTSLPYSTIRITQLNANPTISGLDQNIGKRSSSQIVTYTIDDMDTSDSLTITEKIDDSIIVRTINNAVRNQEYILDLAEKWSSLSLAQHTASITVDDGKGVSARTYTFEKIDDRIEFQTKPIETSIASKTIVFSGNLQYPSDTEVHIYACNNAYDNSPSWEEITAKWLNKQAYSFVNTTKTADKWGIAVKIFLKPQGV